MINKELISPKSIVVVGGSNDLSKPGGSALRNLIAGKFNGELSVVNPSGDSIQGIEAYRSVEELPQVELAILSIPAAITPQTLLTLCSKKGCKAAIIYSAGFKELNSEGAELEKELVNIANQYSCTLIGPNCIGVLTPNYWGVFTKPTPLLDPKGALFMTSSGATGVFIMEALIKQGVKISSLFSIGNGATVGVEEILEFLDYNYDKGEPFPTILLYLESINNPSKLFIHASSLVRRGVSIVALKSGYSEAGERAASSHTGAIASPDRAVDALFAKIGIIRCHSRSEMVHLATLLSLPKPKGNRVAVITHAGGPAVMLTDALSINGLEVPQLGGAKAQELLQKLYLGSSVSNPIDFLATGSATQLSEIIDFCEEHSNIDSMAVIFGSPGLVGVEDVYEVILQKSKSCKKPIYPVLPSIINAASEVDYFHSKGGVSFSDESSLGWALSKLINHKEPFPNQVPPTVDYKAIREVIDGAEEGYLPPDKVQQLLDAAGVARVKESVVTTEEEAAKEAADIGYPLVIKAVGPVHKSDVGGVVLDIKNRSQLITSFKKVMKIEGCHSILIQPMLSGVELFIGVKREEGYGHMVLCGLGGIFVELLEDVATALGVVSEREAEEMVKSLKGYKVLTGYRGKEGVNLPKYYDAIRRVSALCSVAPEIAEMDLNPLLGNGTKVVTVDCRVLIEKSK